MTITQICNMVKSGAKESDLVLALNELYKKSHEDGYKKGHKDGLNEGQSRPRVNQWGQLV